MRVLFFDDDEERHQVFPTRAPADTQIDHARSITEACRFLDQHVYDEVWLDHDMDLRFREGDDDCGCDVAEYIALHVDLARRPKKIILHTVNRDGAVQMAGILRDAGIRSRWHPF